ncbi:alpha/beta hydrolase family protein [Nocardia salmonicida]|uniref:hypothetical protein n=1 Tax=Nocardia salmonicida TaxID=53431 RepID=UPI0007A3B070|nr:hypothetical protein [Nocardia salmonicida]
MGFVDPHGGWLSSTFPCIKAVAEDHGPFAGIAGFCEGAAIGSAALHRQAPGHNSVLGASSSAGWAKELSFFRCPRVDPRVLLPVTGAKKASAALIDSLIEFG